MSYADDSNTLSEIQSQKYKDGLMKARAGSRIAQAKKMASTAKNIAKAATPLGIFSLMKQIDWFKDWLYLIAVMFAIAKDLVDLVGIGSLPAIGTIISICCSIIIFMLMLLAGSSGKLSSVKNLIRKSVSKYLVLLGGTLAEAFLFGLNFLPIQTATVIIIYVMVLAERKQEAEAGKNQQATGEEYA